MPKGNVEILMSVGILVSLFAGGTNSVAQPEGIASAQDLLEKIRLSRFGRPSSFSLTVRKEQSVHYTGPSHRILRDDEEVVTTDLRVDGPRFEALSTFETSNGRYQHRCVFPSKEDPQFLYYVPGEHPQVTLSTGDLAEKRRNTHWAGTLTDLISIDEQPFYELFSSYPDFVVLSPETEKVGDSFCYVMKADIPPDQSNPNHRRCEVWIDPEHGYNVARAIMKEVFPPTSDIPKMKERERRLVAAKFVKVGDNYFISEAQYSNTTKYNTDTIGESANKYTVDNIVVNPDFSAMGAFNLDFIPDGTRVYKDGEPAFVRYEWRNGKAVPAVSEIIENLDDDIDLMKTAPGDRRTSNPVTAASKEVEPIRTDTTPPEDETSYRLLVCISGGIVLVLGVLTLILINKRRH